MPPKAAAPPPDEAHAPPDGEARARMQALFRGLWEYVAEAETKERAMGWAVDRSVDECLDLVDMTYTPREDAAMYLESVAQGSWEADAEPLTRPIDPWARATLVTKEPEPVLDVPDAQPAKGGSAFRPRKPPPAADEEEPVPPPIRLWNMPQPPPKKLSPEEIDRERRLLDDIETRKRAAELAQKRKDYAEEEVKNLAQLHKDLKGQDYGYDQKGAVCLFTPVQPERLPEQNVNPDTELYPLEDVPADYDRPAGFQQPKPSLFLPAEMADGQELVERFQLSGGVTLREGPHVKSGPKAKPDPEHLTQKEFLSLVGKDRSSDARTTSAMVGAEEAAAAGAVSAEEAAAAEAAPEAVLAPDPVWLADAVPLEPPPAPPPRQDPNVALTSASDWGMNPPVKGNQAGSFPRHPNRRVLTSTLGATLPKLPRDRRYAPRRPRSPALEVATPRTRNPDRNLPPMQRVS